MKFHLNQAEGLNLFTAFGDNHLFINQQRYDQPGLLVGPDSIDPDWSDGQFDALSSRHFEVMLALAPEIALLGTGDRQRFPHPSLIAPLINAGIGIEIMDTRAACRTYNILVSEGRKVVIALLMHGQQPQR